jgi:centromere protein C
VLYVRAATLTSDLFSHIPEFLGIIGYKEQMVATQLPITAQRAKGESKLTGTAAQAFNVSTDANPLSPGYIMGNLTLPPKGIKDAESVGSCAQTFTVVFGQDKALEVAFGHPDDEDGTLDPETAQRFCLSPGDVFRVPPGNCYRIQNHSKKQECFLTWTIIRAFRAMG